MPVLVSALVLASRAGPADLLPSTATAHTHIEKYHHRRLGIVVSAHGLHYRPKPQQLTVMDGKQKTGQRRKAAMELMIFAYSRHAERNRWRCYAIHQHRPSAISAAA